MTDEKWEPVHVHPPICAQEIAAQAAEIARLNDIIKGRDWGYWKTRALSLEEEQAEDRAALRALAYVADVFGAEALAQHAKAIARVALLAEGP